jgi:hypothetical protein
LVVVVGGAPWLIVERLTLPDIFTEQEIHELVDAAVQRSLNA